MLVSHSHKFIFIKSKKTAGSSLQDYLAKFCKNGIVEKYIPGGHRPAQQTKEMVGEEVWNSYLKILPIRNPWDKMVSWYYWRARKRSVFVKIKRILKGKHPENEANRMSFRDFIVWLDGRGKINLDDPIVLVDGKWPDYFFIRYECLHEDFEKLCKKLSVPFNLDEMPKQKMGIRKKRDYQSLYDDETKEIIRKAYQEEIDLFDYKF